MKKIKKFLKKNLTNLVVLFAAVGVLGYTVSTNSKLARDQTLSLAKLNQEFEKLTTSVDSQLERLEKQVLKLKQEGFVEPDEFPEIAGKISMSVVVIGNAREVTRLSETGEAIVVKEASSGNAVGTGFFVSNDGVIATAKHVVETIGKDELVVKMMKGSTTYPAEVIKIDDRSDIALLKIQKADTSSIELGHDENLKIGEEIGFLGFAPQAGVTSLLAHHGVVSSKGTDQKGNRIFTINAFVNRGNSGGPVFSLKTGRVLGLMSSRQRDTGSDRYITLPPGFSSGFRVGNTDPLKLSVDLHNETLKAVGEVSQVGIGVVHSADTIRSLLKKD